MDNKSAEIISSDRSAAPVHIIDALTSSKSNNNSNNNNSNNMSNNNTSNNNTSNNMSNNNITSNIISISKLRSNNNEKDPLFEPKETRLLDLSAAPQSLSRNYNNNNPGLTKIDDASDVFDSLGGSGRPESIPNSSLTARKSLPDLLVPESTKVRLVDIFS